MFTILALTAMPMVSAAQGRHTEFATASSQPQYLPTQAPAIATRAPFAKTAPGSAPIVIIQSQPVGNFLLPTPNPVFIPDRQFLSDPFVLPPAAFSATQQIPPQVMDPVHILVPGQTTIPAAAVGQVTTPPSATSGQAYFGPPATPRPSRPATGTSRNDVLRQFGQPSVTIVTSTGETLYFDGGITVRLENGQVTGSK